MRTIQRAAAVVGLTLITGGVFGFAATAATAAPTGPSTESSSANVEHRRGDHDRHRHFGDRRDRRYTIDRLFRSREACQWYGWVGDRAGKWEDPRCHQIGRRLFILSVEPDHDRRWRGRH